MKKSVKTRNQLLYTVGFLTLLSVVVAGISFILFKKDHEIYRLNTSVHKIYEHYTSAATCEENFLYKESGAPDFNGSDESYSTRKFNLHLKAMHLRLEELMQRPSLIGFQLEAEIEKLRSEISKYETLFAFALNKADESGLDNFGTSLKLQRNEWELEQRSEQIGLSNVLTLEKIEKDYLLKNDVTYVSALESKVDAIGKDISQNKDFDFEQKITLIKLLHDFRHSFLDLVKTHGTIGFQSEEQLNDQLFKTKEKINKQFVVIDKKLAMKEQMLTSNIENLLLIFMINIITLSLFIIFLYTRKEPTPVAEEIAETDDKVVEMRNSALAS